MAVGDIGAVIDSLEWSAVVVMDLRVLYISGDVYAIVYRRQSDNRGIVCTFSIDSAGNIGAAIIDSLIFDVYGRFPAICHVSGDVYAIVYCGPDQDGWMCTLTIDASGNIGAAPIDTWEYDTVAAQQPRIINIAGDVFAVVYWDATNNLGELFTLTIANDGTIGAEIDRLSYMVGKADESYILHISGDIYAIAYMGVDTDGFLTTIAIDSSGNIGAATIDSLEFEAVECSTPMLIHVSDDYYAICYRGPDADGWLATVTIDSSGNIGAATVDTLEFDAVRANIPTICLAVAGYYAIAWGDVDNLQTEVCTVPIDNIGNIGAVIDQDVVDVCNIYGYTHIFPIGGSIFAIAYAGPDNHGWVKTFSIDTGALGWLGKSANMAAKLMAAGMI